MLILLSTYLIVTFNESSIQLHLMMLHACVPYPPDVSDRKSSEYSSVTKQPTSMPNPTTTKPIQPAKSTFLQTLSVEDAQEKRNRILRQKSSTETSGLGSSLDYTSTDELNNSRRHSSISNTVIDTKTVTISNRKVAWRNLPSQSVHISQGLTGQENSILETIESSGSSHANNDHSTPQSLNDFDHCVRVFKPNTQLRATVRCEKSFDDLQQQTVGKLPQDKIYYDSDLDFGTAVLNNDRTHDRCKISPGNLHNSEPESKRKLFHLKSRSSESDKVKWCNWSREKQSESKDCCHVLQNMATKNTDYTELQSLIPKSNYSEMDQSLNNESNITYSDHNNPSTSQSSNPQSCNDTMQISATYFAELSRKTLDKKRRDEESRLTHEQIHYLVEYWDHDTFVRLRTWALCFALLAVGLQVFVGISGSWSFFGDEKYPNYSGLWLTCIPENNTCIQRIPFVSPDNGYRDSILCLLAVSTIFSIGGSGLSFTGLCVTALARKLYYYHSAGEIFFVSGMTMALAVSLYSITMEIHIKFYKHRYGYTFWLAGFAAFLLLLSALNLLMDELIQGSIKCRSCTCFIKCCRCCCSPRSQTSDIESQIFVQQPQTEISLRRTNSRRPRSNEMSAIKIDNAQVTSRLANNSSNATTHWRANHNDMEEDFV